MISRNHTLPCCCVKLTQYVYYDASSPHFVRTLTLIDYAGTFYLFFCFVFLKGQTDLTTVSEIGILIVHFVYLTMNKTRNFVT